MSQDFFTLLIPEAWWWQVYRGVWRREVAVKIFRKMEKQEQLDAFARETNILRPLNHPVHQWFQSCLEPVWARLVPLLCRCFRVGICSVPPSL